MTDTTTTLYSSANQRPVSQTIDQSEARTESDDELISGNNTTNSAASINFLFTAHFVA